MRQKQQYPVSIVLDPPSRVPRFVMLTWFVLPFGGFVQRMRGKPWPVNLVLLATLAALICCAAATPVAAPPRGGPYGAWKQISNLNDPEVLEMARCVR